MVNKPSLNDRKLDASMALVRAYNNWRKVNAEYPPFSQELKDATEDFDKVLRAFKRLQKQ